MSGRINRYLNQRATWGKRTGVDEYGEITRETSMIDCRIEKRIRLSQDMTGRAFTSSITVYLEPPEGVVECEDLLGDTINGMPIITASEMVDGKGNIVGYEVLL